MKNHLLKFICLLVGIFSFSGGKAAASYEYDAYIYAYYARAFSYYAHTYEEDDYYIGKSAYSQYAHDHVVNALIFAQSALNYKSTVPQASKSESYNAYQHSYYAFTYSILEYYYGDDERGKAYRYYSYLYSYYSYVYSYYAYLGL